MVIMLGVGCVLATRIGSAVVAMSQNRVGSSVVVIPQYTRFGLQLVVTVDI